jgi:carbamoyl-phosphate synthase large subunit
MILPPQKTYLATVRKIKKASRSIVKSLEITGPFNIQFIAKENQIKVIECNLRASRSFPFVSKVFKVNFIDLATRAMMNSSLPEINKSIFEIDYVGVKAPQFSFSRLKGADPVLGVEMASTGEVACLGDTLSEAFLKAMISTGFKIPRKNILISVSGDKNKFEILESVKRLYENGYSIYTTEHTKKFYERYGIITKLLYKIHKRKEPNIITYLKNKKIDMVISMPEFRTQKMKEDTYIIRRLAVDFSIPLLNNCQIANLLVYGMLKKNNELKIKTWDEYK